MASPLLWEWASEFELEPMAPGNPKLPSQHRERTSDATVALENLDRLGVDVKQLPATIAAKANQS